MLSAKLDGLIFNLSDPIDGERINSGTFAFRIPLPCTISSGDFVILMYLHTSSGKCLVRPVCISLKRRKPLPSRAYLTHIPDIVQEKPTYSGAAIGSMLKNLYGDHVKQTDLREMIDFSLNRSGYEPFQTWRILLRRILTSSADKKDQLPECKQLAIRDNE